MSKNSKFHPPFVHLEGRSGGGGGGGERTGEKSIGIFGHDPCVENTRAGCLSICSIIARNFRSGRNKLAAPEREKSGKTRRIPVYVRASHVSVESVRESPVYQT